MARTISPKDPAEVITVTFRFQDALDVGETISAGSVTATVFKGVDPTPSAIISGAAVVLGDDVLQKIVGGVEGVMYHLKCQMDTSTGKRLVLAALLPVVTE